MTFVDRARAHAEDVCANSEDFYTWLAGAQWAAEQDPTEAEVEAAARVMFNLQFHNQASEASFRDVARAALRAARDVRSKA